MKYFVFKIEMQALASQPVQVALSMNSRLANEFRVGVVGSEASGLWNGRLGVVSTVPA